MSVMALSSSVSIETAMPESVKSCPATWQGEVVLACRKCQKKLKKHSKLEALGRMNKTVKRLNRSGSGKQLHVIPVGCMDVCPKDAVTACLPARHPDRLLILRSEADVEALYQS